MFSISTFTLITALASAFVAHAQVDPSEPSPGNVFPEGGSCPIAWKGDTSSTVTWKSMNIELMTGDNFDMVHITTVTTGQDGTVDGQFTYTCPQVTLHSAVYFYQFTNELTADKTWTGRFGISTPAGVTTPAPNATQPGTNENIPWGLGALLDPSKAVPAPGSGSASAVASQPLSSTLLIAPSSVIQLPSPSSTISPVFVQPPSSMGVVTSVVIAPSSTPSSTTGTNPSGATALSTTSVMTSFMILALTLMFI